MQSSNSLKSSIIGNADTPKLATFHPLNLKSRCNNNPPKVNKKKVTKLGAGQPVNQTRGSPPFSTFFLFNLFPEKFFIADVHDRRGTCAAGPKVFVTPIYMSHTYMCQEFLSRARQGADTGASVFVFTEVSSLLSSVNYSCKLLMSVDPLCYRLYSWVRAVVACTSMKTEVGMSGQ